MSEKQLGSQSPGTASDGPELGSQIATFAPIRVSIEFAFTDGNQVANASIDCAPGELPTAEYVSKAAVRALQQVQAQLGEQFWWQTRHGFLSDEMAERLHGVRFAIPGPDEWKAEWAA